MKKLAIGVDDFKKLRDHDAYFVDKSLFIEEIINDISEVVLFPRPRRFGKTLNMSMLQHFFSNKNVDENRKLFEGLAIQKSPVFELHQGGYPVISLSFKSCKGQNYGQIYGDLKRIIADTFKKHKYILEKGIFSTVEMEKYRDLCDEKSDEVLMGSSLFLLCSYLYRYYERKVIIIIDEYDTPIHEAFLNGFYKEAIDFFRKILGNALKGNEFLQKGILTGILRVSKESMFSDLNNVITYSVLSEKYNTYFGFTQKEVDQLLADFDLSGQNNQVKDWYNGYYFGNEEIYNPWSILYFADSKGVIRPYWLSTSANALVHNLIKDSDKSVKKDIEDALNNLAVYSPLDDSIAFEHLSSNREHILSFLVQTGYLKARYHKFDNNAHIYRVEIPNTELSIIYHTVINNWFNESLGSNELNNMLNALITDDLELFEEMLNIFVVNYLSYFQTSKDHIEKVYHAFVLGMLITLKDSYHIESEKESGFGRVDILMTPKDNNKPGIIIEMKKMRVRETAEAALDAALEQIESRNYEATLRNSNCSHIIKVAVTFDGKQVWVKKG